MLPQRAEQVIIPPELWYKSDIGTKSRNMSQKGSLLTHQQSRCFTLTSIELLACILIFITHLSDIVSPITRVSLRMNEYF
jgi:hypothetical protein